LAHVSRIIGAISLDYIALCPKLKNLDLIHSISSLALSLGLMELQGGVIIIGK
jgi:hypothetical protein